MSNIMDYLKGSLNPVNIFKTVRHNILFARNNPDYFYPAGIWVFCGPQGSGKHCRLFNVCKRCVKSILKLLFVLTLM